MKGLGGRVRAGGLLGLGVSYCPARIDVPSATEETPSSKVG